MTTITNPRKLTMYICDPTLNVDCPRRSCLFGGANDDGCYYTRNAAFAARDDAGNPITMERFKFDRFKRGIDMPSAHRVMSGGLCRNAIEDESSLSEELSHWIAPPL